MAGTRVEKYRKYRQAIAARSDNIPVSIIALLIIFGVIVF